MTYPAQRMEEPESEYESIYDMRHFVFPWAENTGGTASGVWPSANRALFVPFAPTTNLMCTGMWTMNATTASNNIDVGIYTSGLSLMRSSGSTAMTGSQVRQDFTITPVSLWAGEWYYAAMAMNGTTGTPSRMIGTNNGAIWMKLCGMGQMDTAFALPATATLAAIATAYAPCFGLKLAF